MNASMAWPCSRGAAEIRRRHVPPHAVPTLGSVKYPSSATSGAGPPPFASNAVLQTLAKVTFVGGGFGLHAESATKAYRTGARWRTRACSTFRVRAVNDTPFDGVQAAVQSFPHA